MADRKSRGRVRGACLCGAVEYEITLPTLTCGHCHCTMCRRSSGAGFLTWTILPDPQLRIPSGADKLIRYASSEIEVPDDGLPRYPDAGVLETQSR
jgi:hypothetical protein